MKAIRCAQFSCLVAALIPCSLAVAQEKPEEPGKGMLMKFDSLKDSAVLDQAGQQIGEVSDVVVNASDGKFRYAAVKPGEFVNRGEELVAVPWGLFAPEQQEGKMSLTFQADEAVLKEAPGFTENQKWPDAPEESFWKEVTGKSSKDTAGGQGMRVSNVAGAKVKSTKGKDIGEVDAVVVDLAENKVAYATVGVGGFLGIGETNVAVPLEAMELAEPKSKDGDKYFQLKFSEEKVKDAPRVAGDAADENLQRRMKRFFNVPQDEKKK